MDPYTPTMENGSFSYSITNDSAETVVIPMPIITRQDGAGGKLAHGGSGPEESVNPHAPNPIWAKMQPRYWRKKVYECRPPEILQEMISEFFGVMILITFGCGANAQSTLTHNERGSWTSNNWAWAAKSGAHMNPAITLCHCLYRGFPWSKFPAYFVSQLLGAITGASIVYACYRPQIDVYEGGTGVRTTGLPTSTAGIFATYPADGIPTNEQFFTEFLASALLMFIIFALSDSFNLPLRILTPISVMLLIFLLGLSFGYKTGTAMNLVRDFGPRLVTWMAGYKGVWSAGNHYFWVPIIAPFLGCATGGLVYDLFLSTPDSIEPLEDPHARHNLEMGPGKSADY